MPGRKASVVTGMVCTVHCTIIRSAQIVLCVGEAAEHVLLGIPL